MIYLIHILTSDTFAPKTTNVKVQKILLGLNVLLTKIHFKRKSKEFI